MVLNVNSVSTISAGNFTNIKGSVAKIEHAVNPSNDNKSEMDRFFWEKMSNKYDVRNMSVSDMRQLGLELYEGGKISAFDNAILQFPHEKFLKEGASVYLTKDDQHGNRDWVEELDRRLADPRFNSDFDQKMSLLIHKLSPEGFASINEMA